MRYLLDTNICIHIIRHKSSKMIQHLTPLAIDDVGIPAIVLAELQYGIEKSVDPNRNQQALLQFLTPFVTVEFDQVDAITYGKIRADLERRGLPIGPLDQLIAAQAISRNLILVTNNTREFSRLAQLQLEDWTLL
jgi:tRNA(fMet)-specific endonuclease VapC